MPLRRYCEEWWRATHVLHANGRVLSPGTLVAAYQAALHTSKSGKKPTGPIGHMLDSLRMAGWSAASATSFCTRTGSEVSALEVSPAAIARMFIQDVGKEVEARAEAKVLEKHGRKGKPGCIWWELVQAFTASRKLTGLQKHVLVCVIAGIYPTKDRLAVWGLRR